jgi:hypothetical protein
MSCQRPGLAASDFLLIIILTIFSNTHDAAASAVTVRLVCSVSANG